MSTFTNPLAAQLLRRIEKSDIRAGVIGLGYVGLPLAVELARAGYEVVGLDIERAEQTRQDDLGIDRILRRDLRDRSCDERRLSATGYRQFLEPVPAPVGVGALGLLGIEHGEPFPIREQVHPRAFRKFPGGLLATVQHDHQRNPGSADCTR